MENLKETTDEEETAEDYGYLSDSDLEDDEYEQDSSFGHVGTVRARPFDPFAIPGEDNIICEEREEGIEKEKVVKIPDMAFVT